MSLLTKIQSDYKRKKPVELSVEDWLKLAKDDSTVYSSPAERMLKAIGEPTLIDTSSEPRLSRIFQNRVIKVYPAFSEFYGMEEVIEKIVGFFRHASQNLEESKQILYLKGAVGTAKSSLAEKLKHLMQTQSFWAIKGSPLNESPLALFDIDTYGDQLSEDYNIPKHRLNQIPSGWLAKRLSESEGDLSQFTVVQLFPSIVDQVAVARTEPGDENNQDISALVGKIDIRKLEKFRQDDPDAYSYSGGLNLSNRGILEFVEMFKAPIKVLHPLLTSTQDRMYNGTEAIGAMPYEGIILAHSNESEFEIFRNNKQNEAFLDRVYIVNVPYCLRISEEVKIYKKLLRNSNLSQSPIAPKTLDLLAEFSVLSRLVIGGGVDAVAKMKIYDGVSLKDKNAKAKTLQEYKDLARSVAGNNEGMTGVSTRFAFKILSKTFNYDITDVAANPVHLMTVLHDAILSEDFPKEFKERLIGILTKHLKDTYTEFLSQEIQKAYMENHKEFGQNMFDRYVTLADFSLQEQDYRDPDTGVIMDVEAIEKELEKVEKGSEIYNVKDFRNEVVNFVLRYREKHNKNPDWTSYNKIKEVLEARLSASTDEILPQIAFGAKRSSKDEKKHNDFVQRMVSQGYTEKQVRLIVDYYIRSRSS